MQARSSKNPQSDLNILAKSIAKQATSAEKEPLSKQPESTKNPAAVALGRLGGRKGGEARAKKLSPERRSEIARKAAKTRWADRDSD